MHFQTAYGRHFVNTLTFPLNVPPASVIGEVRRRVERHGGALTGDAAAGAFRVKGVEGNYTVADTTLTIQVVSKPFLLPAFLIEAVIKKQARDICNGQ